MTYFVDNLPVTEFLQNLDVSTCKKGKNGFLKTIVLDLVLFERMLLSQISRRMLETTLILIDSHIPLFI
jgi:hypothetical protein